MEDNIQSRDNQLRGSVMPEKRRARQVIEKFLILSGSLMLSFFAGEAIVRLLDLPPKPLDPLPIPSYQLSSNPAIMFEYQPNYKPQDTPYDWQHSGFATNSSGFRDYEYREQKPAGVYRIIVLGDSTTAGNGIPDLDKTYTKQLEYLLNNKNNTGTRYEVLNMGVGGYQTMQEVETLKVKGLRFDPDMVLITFCLNDFTTDLDGSVYEALRGRNPSWLRNPAGNIFRAVLRNSRLSFIVYHRVRALFASETSQEQWYRKNILKGKTPVRAGFELLSELQSHKNFSAYVVILPDLEENYHTYQYRYIHEAVFQAAKGLPGITVIDVLEQFARVNDRLEVFSFDGFHMNAHGHKVMAGILYPLVKKTQEERGNSFAGQGKR